MVLFIEKKRSLGSTWLWEKTVYAYLETTDFIFGGSNSFQKKIRQPKFNEESLRPV